MAKFKVGDRVKGVEWGSNLVGRIISVRDNDPLGKYIIDWNDGKSPVLMKERQIVAANSTTVCNDSLARALKTVNDITKKWGAKDGLNLLKELKASIVRERGDQFYREVEGYVKTGKEIPRNVVGKIGREIHESVLRRPTKLTGEIMDITGPKIKYRNSTSHIAENKVYMIDGKPFDPDKDSSPEPKVGDIVEVIGERGKKYKLMKKSGMIWSAKDMQNGMMVHDQWSAWILPKYNVFNSGSTSPVVANALAWKAQNSAPVAKNADWKSERSNADRMFGSAVANLHKCAKIYALLSNPMRDDIPESEKRIFLKNAQCCNRALSAFGL